MLKYSGKSLSRTLACLRELGPFKKLDQSLATKNGCQFVATILSIET